MRRMRESLVTKVKKRVRWTDTRRPHPNYSLGDKAESNCLLCLLTARGDPFTTRPLVPWYVSQWHQSVVGMKWKDVHGEMCSTMLSHPSFGPSSSTRA